MGLGAVDDHAVQAELLGQADGGDDVVRPVGVEVGGQRCWTDGSWRTENFFVKNAKKV